MDQKKERSINAIQLGHIEAFVQELYAVWSPFGTLRVTTELSVIVSLVIVSLTNYDCVCRPSARSG